MVVILSAPLGMFTTIRAVDFRSLMQDSIPYTTPHLTDASAGDAVVRLSAVTILARSSFMGLCVM